MAKRKVQIEIDVVLSKKNKLQQIQTIIGKVMKDLKALGTVFGSVINAAIKWGDELTKVRDLVKEIRKDFDAMGGKVPGSAGGSKKGGGGGQSGFARPGSDTGQLVATVFKVNALQAAISRLTPTMVGGAHAFAFLGTQAKFLGAALIGVALAFKGFQLLASIIRATTRLTLGIMALTASVTALITVLGLRKLAAFNAQIRRTAALLGGGADKFRELREEALGLSRVFGVAPLDIAQAQFKGVTSGAREADERVSALTNTMKLAIVQGADYASTINLLTTVQEAFGLSATEMDQAASLLFTTVSEGNTDINNLGAGLGRLVDVAGAVGFNLKEVLALTAVLSRSNSNATSVIFGLTTALTNLVDVFTKSDKASKTLRAEFRVLGLPDTLEKVLDTGILDFFQQLEQNSADATGAIRAIFKDQRSFTRIIAAVRRMPEIRKVMEKFTGSTAELQRVFLEMQGELESSFRGIRAAFDRILITFFKSFESSVGTNLMGLTRLLTDSEGTIADFGQQAGAVFAGLAETVRVEFTGMFREITTALNDDSLSMGEKFTAIFDSVIERVKKFGKALFDIFSALFTPMFLLIAVVFKRVVVGGFRLAFAAIKAELLPLLFRLGLDLAKEMALGIAESVTTLADVWFRSIRAAGAAVRVSIGDDAADLLGLPDLSTIDVPQAVAARALGKQFGNQSVEKFFDDAINAAIIGGFGTPQARTLQFARDTDRILKEEFSAFQGDLKAIQFDKLLGNAADGVANAFNTLIAPVNEFAVATAAATAALEAITAAAERTPSTLTTRVDDFLFGQFGHDVLPVETLVALREDLVRRLEAVHASEEGLNNIIEGVVAVLEQQQETAAEIKRKSVILGNAAAGAASRGQRSHRSFRFGREASGDF